MSLKAIYLDQWLKQVGAIDLWTAKNTMGSKITAYLINHQLAIVVLYGDRYGWELFVPACNMLGVDTDKNSVAFTLDGAAKALGVMGCRDIVPEDIDP